MPRTDTEERTRSSEIDPDELWTARDVARWSKTSVSAVYKWSAGGILPSIKIGSLLRFNPNDVKAFFLSGGAEGPKA